MEALVDVKQEAVDWRKAATLAEDLAGRSKDLRIGAQLARAVLATEGLVAYADVVDMLRQWQADYWDQLHPELEEAAEGLPQPRVSALSLLIKSEPDPEKTLNSTFTLLRNAPIIEGRVGSVCLRDYQRAVSGGAEQDDESDGEQDGEQDGDAQGSGLSVIAAVFNEEGATEKSAAAHAAVVSLMDNLVQITRDYDDRLGYGSGPNVEKVSELLKEIRDVLETYGGVGATSESAVAGETAGTPHKSAGAVGVPGVIASRDDAIAALNSVCTYFEKNEPSSPVPLLLRRAKKLISKNFIEVLQELTPDAVHSAEQIIGSDH